MTRPLAGSWSMSVVALIFLATPANGQTAAEVAKHVGVFGYDASKEITLTGTVSNVITKSEPGTIMGCHLLLQTKSGAVDASLGWFAMRGKGALSVWAGEQMAITGFMKTIGNEQVFLARLVKTNDGVYLIRNERGLVLFPQARERLSQQSAEKGAQP